MFVFYHQLYNYLQFPDIPKSPIVFFLKANHDGNFCLIVKETDKLNKEKR